MEQDSLRVALLRKGAGGLVGLHSSHCLAMPSYIAQPYLPYLFPIIQFFTVLRLGGFVKVHILCKSISMKDVISFPN